MQLRDRFIEDMRLAGYSARTQEAYVHAVARLVAGLASRQGRSPRRMCADTSCTSPTSRRSPAALRPLRCAPPKLFFEKTLTRSWTTLEIARPAPQSVLPVVLSREEVAAILALVRIPVYRVCLSTIYACGLRLMEGARLQVSSIDASRMTVQIRGKGNHDRVVPLPEGILLMLRSLWLTHRSPHLGIPRTHSSRDSLERGERGRSLDPLQPAVGVPPGGEEKRRLQGRSCSHPEHSWATHLLEDGVSLRAIQSTSGTQARGPRRSTRT